MYRKLDKHRVSPADDCLTIEVVDAPGSGGACHKYEISGFDARNNASYTYRDEILRTNILFQNGPIAEHGVNGITQEVLLAIVADRLESFQAGPYACLENAYALQHTYEALHWLQQRTITRLRKGIEGTSQK